MKFKELTIYYVDKLSKYPDEIMALGKVEGEWFALRNPVRYERNAKLSVSNSLKRKELRRILEIDECKKIVYPVEEITEKQMTSIKQFKIY